MTKKEFALKLWEEGYNVGYLALNDERPCEEIAKKVEAFKKFNEAELRWGELSEEEYKERLEKLSRNNSFFIYNASDSVYELNILTGALDIIIIDKEVNNDE